MSTRALPLTGSTIGKKMVMAVSGFIYFGFVIAHMLGNLQFFAGRDALNNYSKMLHSMPGVLWGARAVLIGALVAHVLTALSLVRQNQAARPVAYAVKKDVATDFAAKTMPLTGVTLLLYIGYHLAHLTLGVVKGVGYQQPEAGQAVDVYQNIVNGFSVPWCAAIYIVAMGALSLHLYHGAWSLFQSLGLNHPRYNDALRSSAVAVAMAVCVGFVSLPVAVMFLGYGRDEAPKTSAPQTLPKGGAATPASHQH
ncbi:MAG: succinate dehydrogenase cytochrome b subunit [Deltaproteobacteria bacterium]|nr:succinate dehydrogenase cytochrome b subunit [Deltaproteobacteria bacterium]